MRPGKMDDRTQAWIVIEMASQREIGKEKERGLYEHAGK
jgi:hypothetical protein